MIVVPAIDLRQGKCVRLRHGKVEDETVYSNDPVAMAKKWAASGAKRLHVVDLDGALTGEMKNLSLALKIKQETGVFVQLGGGIRTLEKIDEILNAGIDRVILGTVVFEEAGLAQQAFAKYKGKIMVAIDANKGIVATRGWKETSGFPLVEALAVVEKLGAEDIIFTDIGRDGTLEGANVDAVKMVMVQTKLKVFASGGVSTLEDIKELKAIDVPGCIVGKSIYDGKMDLAEAIKLAN